MRKVNQKDIAESLNISRVTVTKALQGHPDIAEKTRKLVNKKALEMGYIPDYIGRSLSSKRTYSIGIVLPKVAHSFFAQSIEKFYEAAHARGYNIIPMISFEDTGKELENIRTLLSMRVEGIILDIASEGSSRNYELAKKAGCKYIFYDRYPTGLKAGAVVTNDYESAKQITEILISEKRKRIIHFSGPPSISIAAERQRGYEDAVKEAGVKMIIIPVKMTVESGYKEMLRLIQLKDIPEAIFAVNDSVAQGIYKACQEKGIRIPNDIAVAGFGDLEVSALLAPPLTTVKMPVEKMTKAAVDMIIEMIENNEQKNKRISFNSKVIIRSSS